MRVNLHGCADAGMADALGEGGEVKVGIIFVVQIIMRHIGMPETMDGYVVCQADCLAYLPMRLIGAAAASASIGESRGTADVLVFPLDGGVLFPYLQLCGFLLLLLQW